MFWCFILLFCLPIRIWTARSGIFVDNGIDQTVMEMDITDDEKKELKEKLLDFLGLPGYSERSSRSVDLRKPAPKFLMNIYESLMNEDGEFNKRKKREATLNFSKNEQESIDISDLIMTFEILDAQTDTVRHEKGKRLWFNISEISLSESIVDAELRIYQDGNLAKKHKQYKDYVVTVLQLTVNDEGESELEYVSSANTTTSFTGWLQLNLTKCVSNWVAFPNSNRGLYISVHPMKKESHEIKPENLGLVTTKGDNPMQPFMVVFLKNINSGKPRQVRDIYTKRSIKSPALTMSSFINRDPYSGKEMRTCNIHTLYVDFEYLNWSSWIIAPPGVPANYCFGKCDFPLNAHVNATNHAIVQSMMHLLMNHLEYPKPCCTPMKLNPISVLYYSEDNSVALKKYKNMVVKSCGCH